MNTTTVIIQRPSLKDGQPVTLELRFTIGAEIGDPDNSNLVDGLVTVITDSGLRYEVVSLPAE